MAEPQLIDYIKKARQANQTDDQSKALLYKNGWTEAEVKDAFAAISQPQPQSQSQPQPQIQPQSQPQFQQKPQQPQQSQQQPQIKPQAQPQIQPQSQVKPMQSKMPVEKKNSHLVLKLSVVFIILAVLGGVGYFIIAQTDLLNNLLNTFSFSPPPIVPVVEDNIQNEELPPPPPLTLATAKLTTILEEYDISKIAVAAFSNAGDKVAYCAPKKVDGKISCFLNDKKLDNAYNFRPYWIGFSPNGERVAFLYLDPVKKQSFVFENGKESVRYDGTIIALKFSDDSKNFMYTVSGKDNKSFAVLNDKPFSSHDKMFGSPTFSKDGKYLLYGARDGQDIFWVADEIK